MNLPRVIRIIRVIRDNQEQLSNTGHRSAAGAWLGGTIEAEIVMGRRVDRVHLYLSLLAILSTIGVFLVIRPLNLHRTRLFLKSTKTAVENTRVTGYFSARDL